MDEIETTDTLRFGSVGQDCQLCLFDMPVEGAGGGGEGDAATMDDTPGAVGVPGAAAAAASMGSFEAGAVY